MIVAAYQGHAHAIADIQSSLAVLAENSQSVQKTHGTTAAC